MYILYADDAGNTGTDYDNTQQPIFSLAGIVVNENSWLELNERINKLKEEVLPDCPHAEIHAADIFSGKKDKNGKFNFRANSAIRNREILEAFVDFIVSEKIPIIYFSVRKENLKEYCKTRYGGAVKIDPYLIAFPYITSFFDHYVSKRKERGLIMLDEQNSILANIDTAFERIRLGGDNKTSFHASNIIEQALFLASSKSNFIQLADVCNFYINRYISLDHGIQPSQDKREHFTKMWDKLKPQIVPPPFDPYKATDLIGFFDDNKEVLGKQGQPAP